MYNIIFHTKQKTITETSSIPVRVWDPATSEYITTTITETTETKYRIPEKFVFETATNCDRFLANNKIMDTFTGSMVSLNSAISMFENSSITSVSGEDGPADFTSLTVADCMFKDCANLTSVEINLPSLVRVKNFLSGCKKLTKFSGSLESLDNGDYLFNECNELNYFDCALDSLTSAVAMFKDTKIVSFTNNLSRLSDASSMFENTSALVSFDVSLPVLVNGNKMFASSSKLSNAKINAPLLLFADNIFLNASELNTCEFDTPLLKSAERAFKGTGIKQFKGTLTNLENGNEMFDNLNLISFESLNLDRLINARKMFNNSRMTTWNINLPKLVDGHSMFTSNTSLKSFNGSLESLSDGSYMFAGCTNLESFQSSLSALEVADEMFAGCKLDAKSVMFICESLASYYGKRSITIGINCTDNTTRLDEFAQSTGLYSSWKELTDTFIAKGWEVSWEYLPSN